MPRSVRFFPVNHDINADPEIWELTDQFGDRALRVWLEVLSIADRNKGEIPGKWEHYPSILAGRCKSTAKHLATVCQWLTRWLDIDSEGVARVRNYAKYHKTRGENKPPPNLTEPNLTYTTPIVPKGDDGFESFWKEYPRKIGKGAAEKVWKKIKPNKETVEAILTAVSVQKKSDQWQKDGGQFIPHPATWLNQKRWEDDLAPALAGESDDPVWQPLKLPLTQAK